MKILMVFIGLLTILASVLPFLSKAGLIPETLTSGVLYSIVIIVIGALALAYGLFARSNYGASARVMVTFISVLIILGGILPLIASFVNLPVPTTGTIYSAIIFAVGAIGLLYGAKAR